LNNNNELIGYVSVRKFGGYALPVPIQNKLLKSYCDDKGYIYVLPLCELYLSDNYMALNSTLKKCDHKSQIGMCSIYMLPMNKSVFEKINKIILQKNIIIHFIFENKIITHTELKEYYILSRIREIIPDKDSISLYS